MAVIAGPTASGKSALALALAQRTNGVIVNADSAQVYADLQIVSARPSEAEMAGVEHRLYGTRDAAEPYSAADWATEARQVVAEVHERGQIPILVGGTGLYLRTLLDGIAEVPPVGEDVRAEVRAADQEENYRRLQEHDPDAAARLHPNDRTRVARALEVVLSSGRTLSGWQGEHRGGIRDQVCLFGFIYKDCPSAWLYPRCDARFAAMMEAGAEQEVARLLARKLSPSLPAMRAIGVPEIAALLEGRMSRAEAVVRAAQATRNYAKRQRTWFRHQYLLDGPELAQPLEGEAFATVLDALTQAAREPAC